MWLWILEHPGETVGIAVGVTTLTGLGWRLLSAHFNAVHRISELEHDLEEHTREANPILRERFKDALADLRALEGVVKELRKAHDDDKRELIEVGRSIEQRLGKEIDSLREWRHGFANQVMDTMSQIKSEIVGELRRAARQGNA